MASAAYFREWRRAHPEYREREKARLRQRRAMLGHGDRAAQRARERLRERQRNGDNGTLESHPLLEQAVALASAKVRRDSRAYVTDAKHDDLVGVIALALVEGCCPHEAASTWLKTEWQWALFHLTGIPAPLEV